ncbi:hypothetical protein CMUS01_14577 [Colletotrichum musicola]|uniref:Uncharacterized protein n=1 Tax=Colletotrichum musicola TaxID=2175873 RepID=A0A8H6MRH8_9PEZI|nr:hypothetical protein CMUS01_14577 [Colletotrichum musicola]
MGRNLEQAGATVGDGQEGGCGEQWLEGSSNERRNSDEREATDSSGDDGSGSGSGSAGPQGQTSGIWKPHRSRKGQPGQPASSR